MKRRGIERSLLTVATVTLGLLATVGDSVADAADGLNHPVWMIAGRGDTALIPAG